MTESYENAVPIAEEKRIRREVAQKMIAEIEKSGILTALGSHLRQERWQVIREKWLK